MASHLIETGISVLGEMPWGTHFCSFYETKQDLLDILIPFFKSGLESNQFCFWIVSNSELLTIQEAKDALRAVLPDLDTYIAEKRIEFAGHGWHLKGGSFDPQRVAAQFKEKADEALARGYAGMRANASPAWLETSNVETLRECEAHLDQSYSDERIILSCTYPISSSSADLLLDIARHHQFVIARRRGDWDVVETPELARAKAEIERLNAELEGRVVERTEKLRATTARLRAEIEERKGVEERLREYEKAVEGLDEMIVVVDREYRYVVANRAFLNYRGLEAEQIVGRRISDLLNRGVFENIVKAKLDECFGGQIVKYEMRYNHPTVGERELSISYFPIEGRRGVDRAACILQDITEAKRAEEALRASESKFRRLLDSSITGVVYWDLNGNLFSANDLFLQMIGYTREDLEQGRLSWKDLTPPEYTHVDEQAIAQLLATGNCTPFEKEYIRKDGSRVSVLIGSAMFNGEKERGTSFVMDITERKLSEERLKATTEQLRALSARLQYAKEEEGKRIARELHDELGSVLTSLKWDLETVERMISESGDRAREGLQDRIQNMLRLAAATIATVRRISSELRPRVLDDLGLVAAIEWQARDFTVRTGIEVQLECSVAHLDLSPLQTTSIFRIFQEALTNILRHAQATKVNISMKKDAGELILTIKDNGRGISEDDKLRAQSLGLLGMRERAHLIGAAIEITGAVEQGTVVTLRVPISNSA